LNKPLVHITHTNPAPYFHLPSHQAHTPGRALDNPDESVKY